MPNESTLVVSLALYLLTIVPATAESALSPEKLRNWLIYGHTFQQEGNVVWEFDEDSGHSMGGGLRFECMRHALKFNSDGTVSYALPESVNSDCKRAGDAAFGRWSFYDHKNSTIRFRLNECEFDVEPAAIDTNDAELRLATDCKQAPGNFIQQRYFLRKD